MFKLLLLAALVCLIESKRQVKFGPYFYVQNDGGASLRDLQARGVKGVTLAFVLARMGTDCTPSFEAGPTNTQSLKDQFAAFKRAGGQITVSTGGAAGAYLDNRCPNADALAAAYQQAVTDTGAAGIDLDIEQDVNYDMTMQAVKKVQDRTGVFVSLTLAADQNGLGARGVKAVQAAKRAGVVIDIINPMAMDYPRAAGESTYGQSVVNCGEAVARQIKQWYPSLSDADRYAMLGVTPMIGVNDCCGAVFTDGDAQTLLGYARSKKIGHIGFWSLNRDQPCTHGENTNIAQGTCSSLNLPKYKFVDILKQYN